MLQPTPPHLVKGIGNTCVYAVGMGTIELSIAGGHTLTLDNVLFIPSSSVRLLSVLTFNRSGSYMSHFDSDSCWVMKRDESIILWGKVLEHCRLYELTAFSPCVTHSPSPMPANALYATRLPNIKSWH